MALHALAHCTSKLLLSAQRDDGTLDKDLQVMRGLAELGMEERFRVFWSVLIHRSTRHIPADAVRSEKGTEPDRESWKEAHALYLVAFKLPKAPDEQKKLARMLKRPIPESIQNTLFAYDAFLRGLGRMSLSQSCSAPLFISVASLTELPFQDLEAHGGLYRLHSHLNHTCTPNISVRHFDQHTALSRITVVARAAIEPGEELLITYVDPRGNYKERRRRLFEWGFGLCQCDRCLTEEGEARAPGTESGEAAELADQLRAGLGLV